MKRFILALAALALPLVAPAAVGAGTIAYDIQNYPAEQNGHTLSGLIITDGTIGMLASSNILSWTYTIDGSITYSGNASNAFVNGDVEASPTQITLAQPPAPSGGPGTLDNFNRLFFDFTPDDNIFTLAWDRSTSFDGTQTNGYAADNGGFPTFVWNTPLGDTLGRTDPWVIAENPEPASLTPLGIGGVALLGYSWRRRRRAAE